MCVFDHRYLYILILWSHGGLLLSSLWSTQMLLFILFFSFLVTHDKSFIHMCNRTHAMNLCLNNMNPWTNVWLIITLCYTQICLFETTGAKDKFIGSQCYILHKYIIQKIYYCKIGKECYSGYYLTKIRKYV